ncbi:hypothetical protein, partial [Streptomyces sp. NPDC005533]|uniref:hypothetical protein n=1 Tax=Streptomyces sp. NPDC005533 TaxID=3364723 RepID=UPI0036C4DF2F
MGSLVGSGSLLVDHLLELYGWESAGAVVPVSGVVGVGDPGGDLDAGLGAGREVVRVDVLD